MRESTADMATCSSDRGGGGILSILLVNMTAAGGGGCVSVVHYRSKETIVVLHIVSNACHPVSIGGSVVAVFCETHNGGGGKQRRKEYTKYIR